LKDDDDDDSDDDDSDDDDSDDNILNFWVDIILLKKILEYIGEYLNSQYY